MIGEHYNVGDHHYECGVVRAVPLNFKLQKWWESCFKISLPLKRNREKNSFYLLETMFVI